MTHSVEGNVAEVLSQGDARVHEHWVDDFENVWEVREDREGLRLDGVASYDCESMELAAVLAQEYTLPYPSLQAINNCRSKYLSRLLWHNHGLCTPRVRLIRSATDAVCFFGEQGRACVFKPVSGSGSELIFRCDSASACETSFATIQNGLKQRRAMRLYKSLKNDKPKVLAEGFEEGKEFSCDFVIENGQVEIIRITRKILSSQGPFGTALDDSLCNARRTADGTAVWEEEDYCRPPLAMEREAILDDYFTDLTAELVDVGEGWTQISDLPSLWDEVV